MYYYEYFSLNILRSDGDCGLDLFKSKSFSRVFRHFQGWYFQKAEPGVGGTKTPHPRALSDLAIWEATANIFLAGFWGPVGKKKELREVKVVSDRENQERSKTEMYLEGT